MRFTPQGEEERKPKPKLLFHRLPAELLRKLLAEELAENTQLAPFFFFFFYLFFFKDEMTLMFVGSLSMHRRTHPTYTIFSFCILLPNLFNVVLSL